MSSILRNLSFFYVLFTMLSGLVAAERVDDDDLKDLIITKEEKHALEKLKPQVFGFLTEDFMKTDFYLIRFIRLAHLDVVEARNMLQRNVQWRQRNNMSTILAEDFSDMEQDYHTNYYGGRDKKGRPFGTMELGEWDLRGAVLQGRMKRLNRYLSYILERGVQELLRAQTGMGRPITKGLVLIDGEGGNAIQHLCAQCLAVLMTWLQNMEAYYPQFLKEIILINAPPVTSVGLRVLKPAMSAETQAALKIFNDNKKAWMPYLDERIDRSQRTKRYGGTLPDQPNQHFYEAVYNIDYVPTE